MKLTLLGLRLHNFKGVKEFVMDTQGGDVEVYGENATGKTSLFDAFTWLLFGKDSQNKVDFGIKTLRDGEPLHGLDHEVEGVFDIDGRKLILGKTYKEQWTKKRGSAEASFTGHTTDHFVDGVPVSKTDYDARIRELVDEDTFKLLTSATYFNESLPWEKRRGVLLGVCGDVSDTDVIASSEKLAELPEILGDRKLEDHRKVIASRKAQINKQLQTLPARIDEVERGLPDVSGLSADTLTAGLAKLQKARTSKQEEVARIEAGGEIAQKRKALAEVDAAIIAQKNRHLESVDTVVAGKRQEMTAATEVVQVLETAAAGRKRVLEANTQEIARLEIRASTLRERWKEISAEEPTIAVGNTCPTCRQALPTAEIAAAKESALAAHNKGKSERLTANTDEGKAVKAQIEKLTAENDGLVAKENGSKIELAEAQRRLDSVTAEIAGLHQQPLQETPEYKALVADKDRIQGEIDTLAGSTFDAAAAVKKVVSDLDGEITVIQADLAKFEGRNAGEQRMEELKDQEKTLAGEYESLEAELDLADEFVRAKVRLLEGKINSKFRLARFKLFDVQVNGAVDDRVCETTYNGVPYGAGLNNAAQIAVGLDIILTLSEHYGVSAPVFIDNAEAVVKLPEIESQVIALYVSEGHKELYVMSAKEAVAV